MKLYNKSQGISIEVIVMAAIALAVLVVTFLIFTSQSSTVSKNLNSCSNKGGQCASSLKINDGKTDIKKYECDSANPIKVYISDSECGGSKLCCLKIS